MIREQHAELDERIVRFIQEWYDNKEYPELQKLPRVDLLIVIIDRLVSIMRATDGCKHRDTYTDVDVYGFCQEMKIYLKELVRRESPQPKTKVKKEEPSHFFADAFPKIEEVSKKVFKEIK